MAPTPPWPLHPDLTDDTRAAFIRLQLDHLTEDLDQVRDYRRRWRLKDRAQRLRQELALLERRQAHLAQAEQRLWADVWATPQSALWHPSAAGDIALFVRLRIRAEQCDWTAAIESRQWSDRLGLNPLALQRLRWWDAVVARLPTRQRGGAPRLDASVLTQARNRATRPHARTHRQ